MRGFFNNQLKKLVLLKINVDIFWNEIYKNKFFGGQERDKRFDDKA